MGKKLLYLLIIITSTFETLSAQHRVSQLISPKKSFISVEAGTFSGISLLSDKMQLSLGYSVKEYDGFTISSDFLFYNLNKQNINIESGVGGGLIFKPEIDYFSSFFYLRFPIKVIYKNFYISGVPMIGSSMFEYETIWDMNISFSIGYQFDINNKEIEKKETP